MNPFSLSFNLAAPLKGEDADPAVAIREKSGFLVVADGLGGSGSSPHVLENNEAAKKRFAEAAYPALDTPLTRKALEEIFPLGEEKEITHTSAFLSSRILIPNFAKALEGETLASLDEAKLALITETLLARLAAVAEAFKLSAPEYGQRLLPSTLVSLFYEEEGDGLHVAALWAGDSRAYALQENGLRQLSKDDEDETGAITNYFTLAKEVSPLLHRRDYHFSGPVTLFVCSDGVFDPFKEMSDAIGVSKAILAPMDEVRDNLFDGNEIKVAHYGEAIEKGFAEHYQEDDVSLALAGFGFSKFELWRRYYRKLREQMLALFSEMSASRGLLLNASESERASLLAYVDKRAHQRYGIIAAELAHLYATKQSDFALDQKLQDLLKKEAHPQAKKTSAETPSVPTKAPLDLPGYFRSKMLAEPAKLDQPGVAFLKSPKSVLDPELKTLSIALVAARDAFVSKKASLEDYTKAIDAFLAAAFVSEAQSRDAFNFMALWLAKKEASTVLKAPTPEIEETTPTVKEVNPALETEAAEGAKSVETVEPSDGLKPAVFVAPKVEEAKSDAAPLEEMEPPLTEGDYLTVLLAHSEEVIAEVVQAYHDHPNEKSLLDEGNFNAAKLAFYRELVALTPEKEARLQELLKTMEGIDQEALSLLDAA